jgi:hypothetical protein
MFAPTATPHANNATKPSTYAHLAISTALSPSSSMLPASTHPNVPSATTSTPPTHHVKPVPRYAPNAHHPPYVPHAHQATIYTAHPVLPYVPILPTR